jgi:hypothetical protein
MNNFNKVFLVVKAHCEKQKNLAEVHSFDAIAREAGVPITKLDMYLDHLQKLDLLRYSREDKYIYLTVFGKKQDLLIRE